MPNVAAVRPRSDERRAVAISGSSSGSTPSRRKRFPAFSSLSLGNKDKTGTNGGSASPSVGSSTSTAVGAASPTPAMASAVPPASARDPKARRGSLPIFDRIPAVKETYGAITTTTGVGVGAGADTTDVAAVVGPKVDASGGPGGPKTELEKRGPPRRRHSASATQIAAISAQAFGGGDAAAYDSDSSSDSSAWLNSDDDD
mmetsp:Transcript_11126/g.24085  ORF Transcript_11126/g.24085 Transcript_11126/m.24085 type:complete len:201 (-) Transcript_11126:110-712(-)